MKPALFDYVAPDSVADAIGELVADDMARPLAGGQSLIPVMNFRIATPSKLVDLRKLGELRGIAVEDGMVRVGAMTRYRELELDAAANRANPLIAEVLANVAHIVVRNRGTVRRQHRTCRRRRRTAMPAGRGWRARWWSGAPPASARSRPRICSDST